MSSLIPGLVAILALSLSGTALFADEDEPKTPDTTTPAPSTKPPEEKPIYLSKNYKEVGEVVAQVFKADSKSVTIRVTWYTLTPGSAPRNNFGHWSQGSNSRNPQQMYQHMLQMQQAMARQAVKAASRSKVQEHHQDYTFPYTEDAHARSKHLPVKTDDNGKKVPYTRAELIEAKANVALSGYERPLDSVKVGAIVELHLGRMVNAPKEKKDDLFIRWLYILDESNVKVQKAPDTNKSPGASKN